MEKMIKKFSLYEEPKKLPIYSSKTLSYSRNYANYTSILPKKITIIYL